MFGPPAPAPPPGGRPRPKPPLSPLERDVKAGLVRSASTDAPAVARMLRAKEWVPEVPNRLQIGWVPQNEVLNRIKMLEKQLRDKDHSFWESAQHQDAALQGRTREVDELREELHAVKAMANEAGQSAQTKEDHLRSLRKAQEEASGGYATDLASAQARLQEAELKCRGVEASLKQAHSKSNELRHEFREADAEHAENVMNLREEAVDGQKALRNDKNRMERRFVDEEDSCWQLEHEMRSREADCEALEARLQLQGQRHANSESSLATALERHAKLDQIVHKVGAEKASIKSKLVEQESAMDCFRCEEHKAATELQEASRSEMALKGKLTEQEALLCGFRDREQKMRSEVALSSDSSALKEAVKRKTSEVEAEAKQCKQLEASLSAKSAELTLESKAAQALAAQLQSAASEAKSAAQTSRLLAVSEQQHQVAREALESAERRLLSASLLEAKLEQAAAASAEKEKIARASEVRSLEEEMRRSSQKASQAETLSARFLMSERAESAKCQELLEQERARLAAPLEQAIQAARLAAQRADGCQLSEEQAVNAMQGAESRLDSMTQRTEAAERRAVEVLAELRKGSKRAALEAYDFEAEVRAAAEAAKKAEATELERALAASAIATEELAELRQGCQKLEGADSAVRDFQAEMAESAQAWRRETEAARMADASELQRALAASVLAAEEVAELRQGCIKLEAAALEARDLAESAELAKSRELERALAASAKASAELAELRQGCAKMENAALRARDLEAGITAAAAAAAAAATRAESKAMEDSLAASARAMEELAELRRGQSKLEAADLKAEMAASEAASEARQHEKHALSEEALRCLEIQLGEERSHFEQCDSQRRELVSQVAELREQMQVSPKNMERHLSKSLTVHENVDRKCFRFQSDKSDSRILQVTVVSGRDSKASTWVSVGGSSSLLCSCGLRGKPSTHFETSDLDKTLTSVWNQDHAVRGYQRGDYLDFKLLAYDWQGMPANLGRASLSCEEFDRHDGFNGEIKLEGFGEGYDPSLIVKVEVLPPACQQPAVASPTSRCRANSAPIFATGIWRDGSAAEALLALRTEFDITVLSQDDEARYESKSVLSMLRYSGIDTRQCLLTVGTGGGSCQFVLYDEEVEVSRAYAKGYKTDSADHASKQNAMKQILTSCCTEGKAFPTLIVAWGAVWYACKGGPINADKAELGKPGPAHEFEGAGFIIPAAKSVPMMIIRNIAMSNGYSFKPHWMVESSTGSYIDLGSSKVALVSLAELGAQEANINFDQRKAMLGNTSEVREALQSMLSRPSRSAAQKEVSLALATAKEANYLAELREALQDAAQLRLQVESQSAEQGRLESKLLTESECLRKLELITSRQDAELNSETAVARNMRRIVTAQCQSVMSSLHEDVSDSECESP